MGIEIFYACSWMKDKIIGFCACFCMKEYMFHFLNAKNMTQTLATDDRHDEIGRFFKTP